VKQAGYNDNTPKQIGEKTERATMNTQLPMRAIALSLLFASGCQAPVPLHHLKTPLFAMGQTDAPVPTMVVGQPSAASGQLTVRFDGELARLAQGRRIQATVADVEKVVVTVTPQGGSPVSKTVLKAAITGGQTSVTFDGLPPGNATVTITAFDAAGVNIGSTSQQATIAVGQVATVDVGLQLNPSFVAGGSTGGGASTGGLTANVALTDGITITGSGPDVPQLAGTSHHDFWVTAMALDGQGNAWVGTSKYTGPEMVMIGGLVKMAPSGEVLAQLNFNSHMLDIAVAPDGYIWAVTEWNNDPAMPGDLLRIAPDGTITEIFDVPPGLKSLAVDSAGHAWVSGDGIPRRYDVSQVQPVAELTQLDQWDVLDMAFDSHDHLWILKREAVECWSQDGTRLTSIPLAQPNSFDFGRYSITVDTHDNVWVVTPDTSLRKIGHAGQVMGGWQGFGASGFLTLGFNSQLLMPDPMGGVWVRSETSVQKVNANGQTVATLALSSASMPGGLVAGPAGVWFSNGSQIFHFAR
jgi:sugar lactone lactonase YvrE